MRRIRVYRDIEELCGCDQPVVVAIGIFDGVHLGHQRIISEAVSEASRLRAKSLVLSFEPHPLEVLIPAKAPTLLTSPEERAVLMDSLGVDCLCFVRFTARVANMTPEQFVKAILIDRLRVETVTIGFNFSFGRKAKGNAETLRELGRKYGFGVRVVQPVKVNGVTVSSTLIRALIARGEVEDAARFLGRPYSLSGAVIPFRGRGREIGFPTANLEVPRNATWPGRGVYAVEARFENEARDGVANIGYCPTFDGQAYTLEVHLLDFDGDLYGERMEVSFIARLRDEMRFAGVQALKEQVEEDIRRARAIMVNRRLGRNESSTAALADGD